MLFARRVITALTGLAVGLIYLATSSVAFAKPEPDPPVRSVVPVPPSPAPVTRIVHLGSPLWMFVLVAAISIALTAATAVVISRVRHVGTTSTSAA